MKFIFFDENDEMMKKEFVWIDRWCIWVIKKRIGLLVLLYYGGNSLKEFEKMIEKKFELLIPQFDNLIICDENVSRMKIWIKFILLKRFIKWNLLIENKEWLKESNDEIFEKLNWIRWIELNETKNSTMKQWNWIESKLKEI